jgi:hypothetical protein
MPLWMSRFLARVFFTLIIGWIAGILARASQILLVDTIPATEDRAVLNGENEK